MQKEPIRPVTSPAAWRGCDLVLKKAAWSYALEDSAIDELYSFIRQRELNLDDLLDLGLHDAPLPRLRYAIGKIRHDLLRGRGFALLRGLPVSDHSMLENACAFWILGKLIGEPVPQNGENHMLGHITNLHLDYSEPDVRGYQTNVPLPYHSDYSDIVALLCLKPAKRGGQSSIVSSVTLFNEMADRRPDLAETLCRPVPHTRWGEVPAGKAPWAETPVFNLTQGSVVTSYARRAIEKAQRLVGAPALSQAQEIAFDYLDSLAADPDLHLDMELGEGDIQFLNNHWTLHSRTQFEDHRDSCAPRHLLRLWLACADGPCLPKIMTDGFQGATIDGRPNGIGNPTKPLIVSADPRAVST